MVRWASGLIYAQNPRFLGKTDEAFAHLRWRFCLTRVWPAVGFCREAYRHLSKSYARTGDAEEAVRYLGLSGLPTASS